MSTEAGKRLLGDCDVLGLWCRTHGRDVGQCMAVAAERARIAEGWTLVPTVDLQRLADRIAYYLWSEDDSGDENDLAEAWDALPEAIRHDVKEGPALDCWCGHEAWRHPICCKPEHTALAPERPPSCPKHPEDY